MCDFDQYNLWYYNPKNSVKLASAAPFIKLYHQKFYQCYFLKLVYCMHNFIQIQAIEPKIELMQGMWEKRNISAPYWAMCTQITSMLFLMMDILYINFCAISSTRNRDCLFPKFWKKWNYSASVSAISFSVVGHQFKFG